MRRGDWVQSTAELQDCRRLVQPNPNEKRSQVRFRLFEADNHFPLFRGLHYVSPAMRFGPPALSLLHLTANTRQQR